MSWGDCVDYEKPCWRCSRIQPLSREDKLGRIEVAFLSERDENEEAEEVRDRERLS
jgi:hypothetical protein